MDHLLLSALAPSTNTHYQHHIQACFDFVKYKLERNWVIPLSLDCIAYFLVFLYQRGNSHSTILTYMSALSYYHQIRKQTDPTNTFYIKKLLNGIKNKSLRVLGLKPISKNILHKMIDMLPFTCETRFD